jgi:hypothetical protein
LDGICCQRALGQLSDHPQPSVPGRQPSCCGLAAGYSQRSFRGLRLDIDEHRPWIGQAYLLRSTHPGLLADKIHLAQPAALAGCREQLLRGRERAACRAAGQRFICNGAAGIEFHDRLEHALNAALAENAIQLSRAIASTDGVCRPCW